MIVWHANLGRGVPADAFRRNLRRVLAAGGPEALYGLQEIDEADQPDEHEILEQLVRRTHTIVGWQTSVPILVPHRLAILEQDVTVGCRGLAKFTPYRPVVEVVFRVGPNLTACALNFHVPIDREQTQSRRADVVDAATARCELRKSQGHAGVWMADTNTRVGWPRIVHGEKTVTAAGIDRAKAWASPGRRVVVSNRQTVNLTIDNHDAHGARVMWLPRRRAA